MRSHINRILLFPLTLIAFYSCNSLSKIGVQIAEPPKHPISADIQSIAILNRSLTHRFNNLERDSLEKILIDNDLNLDTVFLDSIASDTCIQIAGKTLFESERFDVVVPKERNIIRKDTGGVLNSLDMNYIDGICKDFNVDGVLVLEYFSEKVSTDFAVKNYNISFESGKSLNEYEGTINVSYNLGWRFYQPHLKPSFLNFKVKDTIFWNSYDYSVKAMYQKLPSIKEALILGGIASGTDMAENISPKWVDVTRKYYNTGNKEIDAAIPLIKMNKWKEAAEIWKKYATLSSNSLRSKVEFNLAVAAEMLGNLDIAIEWGVKSYKSHYTREAELYLKYLDRRRSALKKVSVNR